ncbi:uncharacterized protein LOC112688985 isoform X2 [Sipha flava]|nr:uncharacterized protein LOC112688985 isoform X2 [Sipha flava]XP_025418242.1 uncharacterized protein LOC112688985 isoform X2 [Sipha flava]
MVLVCSVISCKTKHSKGSGIKFHKYPADIELKMKWLASIKNPNWFVPYPRSVVCSKHFDDDDYKINVWGHKKLKINAIPKSTINRQFLLNEFEVLYVSTENSGGSELNSNVSEIVNTITSGTSNLSTNSTMDLDDSIILGSLDENNVAINLSITTPTPKKRKPFRYLGDFKEEDLETPRIRKMFWSMYKTTLDNKIKAEKVLKQKNYRLKMKIKALNSLIDKLQADNKITAKCSND